MANFQNEREQLGQLEWLFQQKKFAEGLARVEPILLEFPASFHLKFLKFKFLRELRQNDEALQLLRQMHAMSGENIMVVKELADLTFQLKQFPESLLFYKKLLFLDSFNVQAQERVKLIQGMLAGGVADRLADTKAEFRPDVATFRPQPAAARPSAAAVEPKQITFDRADVVPASGDMAPQKGDMAPVPPAMNVSPSEAEDPHFQTESAAELYFKQGLYREALAVYKNLFEKTGRTDHFLKVKAILLLLRTDRGNRVIERLQKFLHLLQQRGSQIV